MTMVRFASSVWCGAAMLAVALVAAGCSTSPAADGSANAAAPAAPSVSGSLPDWQDAVCRDDVETDSGTHHTVGGSACVPQDGDGIVNFDQFDSAASMDSMLSWNASPYVAKTVVDGHPTAIWTPSGEKSDLDPLQKFGLNVVSYQSASFTRNTADLPAAVPDAVGDPVTIPSNQYGYAVVQNAAADTQCIVESTYVGCQTDGTQWQPHPDGSGPFHGVRINTDGTGSWVDGNLGAPAPTTLTDQTYRAQGWTIVSTATGMRFTNDKTGHGALVSVPSVQPF